MFEFADIWSNPLLGGAVPTLGLAVAGAVVRLRKNKVEAEKKALARAAIEKTDTEKRLDRMELFLIGKVAEGGMPKIDGFLDDFTTLKNAHLELTGTVTTLAKNVGDIGENVSELRGDVSTLLQEWTPNGGQSSYDKLERLDQPPALEKKNDGKVPPRK